MTDTTTPKKRLLMVGALDAFFLDEGDLPPEEIEHIKMLLDHGIEVVHYQTPAELLVALKAWPENERDQIAGIAIQDFQDDCGLDRTQEEDAELAQHFDKRTNYIRMHSLDPYVFSIRATLAAKEICAEWTQRPPIIALVEQPGFYDKYTSHFGSSYQPDHAMPLHGDPDELAAALLVVLSSPIMISATPGTTLEPSTPDINPVLYTVGYDSTLALNQVLTNIDYDISHQYERPNRCKEIPVQKRWEFIQHLNKMPEAERPLHMGILIGNRIGLDINPTLPQYRDNKLVKAYLAITDADDPVTKEIRWLVEAIREVTKDWAVKPKIMVSLSSFDYPSGIPTSQTPDFLFNERLLSVDTESAALEEMFTAICNPTHFRERADKDKTPVQNNTPAH